jgi:hypothetical protein
MHRLAALALFAVTPAFGQADTPTVAPVWTISSPDCIGVNADGEPWQECGFQAFDMNTDSSRVLTVSTLGTIQLWDGADGRELRRVDWFDQPGGASGFPNAKAIILGDVAVVIVHQNQLILLSLADGSTRSQTVMDVMTLDRIARFGNRFLVEYRRRDWSNAFGELDFASGTIRPVPGLTDVTRVGPSHWVEGRAPPFTIHRAAGGPVSSERSCMPFDADFCTWRELPGNAIHFFDIARGSWRDFDLGQTYDGFTSIDPIRAGDRFFAMICGRTMGATSLRPCAIRDLAEGRDIHQFNAMNAWAVGALDEQGRPEVRLRFQLDYGNRGESRRVAMDGTVRRIEASLNVNLLAPNGGFMLPDWRPETALLADAGGRVVARLPFPSLSCGGAHLLDANCRFTSDRRRWLVPRNVPMAGNAEDHDVQLGLYELSR